MTDRAERTADWIPVHDALERILGSVHPLADEDVALTEALGRVLAAPLVSAIDQPAWDNSAMDGFAVRSADILGATPDRPHQLEVVESVAAGQFPSRRVEAGQAIHIMTGAPIPDGADCVVRVEHTRPVDDQAIEVLEDGDAGRNIRPRGEDVRRGSTVLQPGTVLRPGEVGVLAMLGVGRPQVYGRPRVGILATGDELVDVDEFAEVEAGRRIVNSNSYALDASVREVGGEPVSLGIAGDDLESVSACLERIGELDVLVTTAGASVGEHDLVKEGLEQAGMRTEFWRVRMRPGSPFSFGLIPRAGLPPLPVFGLPGNPVSAVVTFEVLGKPALRRMTGRTEVYGATRRVRVAEPIRSNTGLTRFLRVHLDRDPQDRWSARLTGEQGSGMLTSVSRADALLVVPEDVAAYDPGDEAIALLLDPGDAAQPGVGY